MTAWKEVSDPEELFRLKREGWEIEILSVCGIGWQKWEGTEWRLGLEFRARPPQPKMKKVKSLCWRSKDTGNLTWNKKEGSHSGDWQRFPAGDIEGEVPDDH